MSSLNNLTLSERIEDLLRSVLLLPVVAAEDDRKEHNEEIAELQEKAHRLQLDLNL